MVVVLKTNEILDEKDKRLRTISKDVTFPLTKEDKDLIQTMIDYLHDSQIEELSEKYDLRPGMGMSAIQLGVNKRYFVVVYESSSTSLIWSNVRSTLIRSDNIHIAANIVQLTVLQSWLAWLYSNLISSLS